MQRNSIATLDAYSRHKKFINDYYLYYGKGKQPVTVNRGSSEIEIVRKHHKFIRYADDDNDLAENWEKRLAKKYYDKLFKEYCLAELKYYRQGRIALRWRTEGEVKTGKGQFTCGSINCTNDRQLKSWEVNFAYVEDGVKKNALVKLRLCPDCSLRLNYRKRAKAADSKPEEQAEETKDHSEPSPKRHKPQEADAADAADEEDEEDEKDRRHWKNYQPASNHNQSKGREKEEEFDEFFEGLFE